MALGIWEGRVLTAGGGLGLVEGGGGGVGVAGVDGGRVLHGGGLGVDGGECACFVSSGTGIGALGQEQRHVSGAGASLV